MPDARQALDALLLAVVERHGAGAARVLLADAAGFALRPTPTEPAPGEGWHSADRALGFGAHLLSEELLAAIGRREQDARITQAQTKKRTT